MKRMLSLDWTKVSYVAKGILVGFVVGLIVTAFRMTLEFFLTIVPNIYDVLREHPLWIIGWTILVVFLGLIVAKLVNDEPRISGNGVSELKAQFAGMIRLNWLSVLIRKFIGSSIVIGLGIPVGRSGPAMQIAGVTGQGLNKLVKGGKSQENIFVSSGVAAGLSAVFNAPISGLLLVLESFHSRFSNILILSVFSSSLVANFISFQVFGIEPAIALAPVEVFPLENYLYLALFGILVAFLGMAFQGMTFGMPKLYKKLEIPNYFIMLIPFLIAIVVGLVWPEMLGGGTSIIQRISSTQFPTMLLAIILIVRVFLFVTAFGTGIPAGMLIPMLTIGALSGAIFGNFVTEFTAMNGVFIRNFVIYGLAGFMTVVNKTPLTGIVLATELTGSVSHLVPISIVALSAYVVADFLKIDPADEITLNRISRSIPKVFEGRLETLTVIVEQGSGLDGESLRDFSFPYNAQISSIKRYKNEFIPHRNTVFYEGDEITISCDAGFVKEVKKYIDRIN